MSNIEKKPVYPFEKIAVAVAFSPNIEAIIAASKRLQNIFNVSILFIHVGNHDAAQETYLKELITRFAFEQNNHEIIWETGDTVDKILEVCKARQVDLLVAGALEKESLLKYFLGSVARKLCRRAKCSILMLRDPDLLNKPVQRIVVEGSDHPKTVATIEAAIYVAKATHALAVDVIQEEDPGRLALIRSDAFTDNEADNNREKMLKHENEKLEEILSCTDCGNLKVNVERLEGKPGFMITKYAREHEADLLVLNSPDTKLNVIDRVFPHDIEFALADLPCDLLIVHSRTDD